MRSAEDTKDDPINAAPHPNCSVLPPSGALRGALNQMGEETPPINYTRVNLLAGAAGRSELAGGIARGRSARFDGAHSLFDALQAVKIR